MKCGKNDDPVNNTGSCTYECSTYSYFCNVSLQFLLLHMRTQFWKAS